MCFWPRVETMLTTTNDIALDQTVETLRFLSDKNRLRILSALTRSETCVCDLIDELGLPQPLVSYHLGKLRAAGLVRARRDAQWVYYSLDPVAWEELLAPVSRLMTVTPLPASATFGSNRSCDVVPADPDRGACAADDSDCC